MTVKVAKLLDQFSVVLNIGLNQLPNPVKVGDIFTIVSEDVIDPQTGENLGPYPKLRVKVTEVYDRFCVAETYRLAISPYEAIIRIDVGAEAQPFTPAELPF